jgi:ATP-dependent Clp protease ATP-binding subunit ClpC
MPQAIGEMTSEEYSQYLAKDIAAERRFQAIHVAEPTVLHTIEILKGLRDRYEAHHQVSITEDALAAAARLADQKLPNRRLPTKAIDLIDEAASLLHMRKATAPPDLLEFDEQIRQVNSEKESVIRAKEWAKAAALEEAEKDLLAKKANCVREWNDRTSMGVNELLVAEALEIMSGLSAGSTTRERQPDTRARLFPLAVMADEDREIWSMS